MKAAIVAILVLRSLLAEGQRDVILPELLATTPGANVIEAEKQLDQFVFNLKHKKASSDVQFLRKVFFQTHKTFLKVYQPYVDMQDIFTSGKYDCLTATSLYTMVLDRLKFDYQIIETNYHIFISVATSDGNVLLETTDRWNGFVADAEKIEQRISSYQQNVATSISEGDKMNYLFHFNLYHALEQRQLPGLLYFNQAVKAYNGRDWEKCADLIDRALAIYNSPRIAELIFILIQSVQQSDWSEETKHAFILRYKNYKFNTATLASR